MVRNTTAAATSTARNTLMIFQESGISPIGRPQRSSVCAATASGRKSGESGEESPPPGRNHAAAAAQHRRPRAWARSRRLPCLLRCPLLARGRLMAPKVLAFKDGYGHHSQDRTSCAVLTFSTCENANAEENRLPRDRARADRARRLSKEMEAVHHAAIRQGMDHRPDPEPRPAAYKAGSSWTPSASSSGLTARTRP